MSSYTELLGYSKQLERRLAALERQEAGGAFYTRSEADAKFLTIADAADNYIDISAYGDFLLATGQATGALIFPQIFSRGIYSYDGIWGSGDPNGDLILEGTSDATKTSSYVILQPTGGKVGIGTSTPGDKLHVSGGGVAVSGGGILLDNNNWFKVKNTGGTAIEIAGIDASNDVYLGAVSNAGGKVVLREDGADVVTISGANVGVGTPTPSEKLSIAGQLAVGGALANVYTKYSTDSRSWWTGIGYISGDDRFIVYDATAAQPRLLIDTSGNVGIGMVPSATEALTANGAISSSGAAATLVAYDRSNGVSKAFGLYTQSNIGRIYSWGGTKDVMAFTETGKVGIGTTGPGAQVELNIPDDLRAGLVAQRSSLLRFQGGQGGAIWGQRWNFDVMGYADVTASRLVIGAGNNSSGSYVASDLVTIVSDGKVGIGTTTPLHRLSLYSATDNIIHMSHGNNANWNALDFLPAGTLSTTNVEWAAGIYPGTSNYVLHSWDGTNALVRFVATYDGKVGIGTAAPGEKLHVAGTGKFGDYCLIGTSVSAGYYQDVANGAYRAITSAGTNGYYFQTNGGGSTTMYVGLHGTYAGNVGIGTQTPQNFKLQVEGRVGVKTGVNAASAMMWVYQDDNGATIPVLRLTQSDLSEEFIYFNATVGTNYPIDTAALGTYYGKVRVSVNGTFKYMPLYNS